MRQRRSANPETAGTMPGRTDQRLCRAAVRCGASIAAGASNSELTMLRFCCMSLTRRASLLLRQRRHVEPHPVGPPPLPGPSTIEAWWARRNLVTSSVLTCGDEVDKEVDALDLARIGRGERRVASAR